MTNKNPETPTSSPLRAFLRKFGLGGNGDSSLRESLEEVIEEHEDARDEETLGEEGREMLLNVLKYNELRTADIMVPRADIVAVEISTPFKTLVEIFCQAGHSRLPIYRKSLDEVVGMVHVKDALRVLGAGKKAPAIEDILRDIIIVPPSMRLIDLLKRMKTQRTHMALVVDEYGGTDGLVTIEDLVEQIVGEIEDEYDEENEPQMTFIGNGIYEADARLLVEDLEEALKIDLLSDEQDENVDTLGGLVFALEGRVPEIGESIDHPLGYRFEIIGADPRRIKKVRIHLPKKKKKDD
ncbi:MAG: HlyC/CorC family transporter [Alphaproteobacteria bacterium]|nr:MAG: HlyC/CorC family transporter [Alphaproteobacteria bacterium]